MALETATFIDQLVPANPTSTDPTGQGAAHLRLIKAALQGQFPNFTAAALASTNAAIDNAVTATANISGGAVMPTSSVIAFAGATAPPGFLLCDGASYSTTTYAALFAAIGYTYGGASGNFNVPDAQGRVIAGNDVSTGRLNGTFFGNSGVSAVGGEANHTLTVGELAAHAHSVADPGHSHTIYISDPGHTHNVYDPGHSHTTQQYVTSWKAAAGVNNASGSANFQTSEGTNAAATGIGIYGAYTGITASSATAGTGISLYNAGSSTAHNNVQPTIVMNLIIKT